jgi:hypothetical protein
MRPKLLPGRVWLLCLSLLLAFSLLPASGVRALDTVNVGGYFEIGFETVQFSQTEIRSGEAFTAAVTATATCIKDLPVSLVSQASVSGRITARHENSGAVVTLNPNYAVTIEPFPGRKGDVIQSHQELTLQFPADSAAGLYSIAAELIEAKVNTMVGWLNVTRYLPPSQIIGQVSCLTSQTGTPAPSSSPPAPITIADFDSRGAAIKPLQLVSEDGSCSLSLTQGTLVLTAAGAPLTGITVTPLQNPPPPTQESKFVSPVYQFNPGGASINPPAQLSLNIERSSIGELIAADLCIARWDATSGGWVPLAGCTVDLNTVSVTADITQLGSFGVLAANNPTVFKVSDLSATPAEVKPGETVVIRVLVANSGQLPGIYRVALRVADDTMEIQEVPLNGGASREVVFSLAEDKAGVYAVAVNGLSSSFTVIDTESKSERPSLQEMVAVVISAAGWLTLAGISALAAVVFIVLRQHRRRY